MNVRQTHPGLVASVLPRDGLPLAGLQAVRVARLEALAAPELVAVAVGAAAHLARRAPPAHPFALHLGRLGQLVVGEAERVERLAAGRAPQELLLKMAMQMGLRVCIKILCHAQIVAMKLHPQCPNAPFKRLLKLRYKLT